MIGGNLKRAAFLLFLLCAAFASGGPVTAKAANTSDSSTVALNIYAQIESNATTTAEFHAYLGSHSLISLGSGMDIAERAALDASKAANPWMIGANESDDSDATLKSIERGDYALVILVGGPEQNAITKRAISAGWFNDTVDVEGGYIVKTGSLGRTVVIALSDKKGFEEGILKREGASYSPLASIMPVEYVPLAATGISILLLILINVGRTVFEFKALDIGRKNKKVGEGSRFIGGINATEALAILGASIVLGISISWQFFGTDFLGWVLINSLICLFAAILHELTHRIFAHYYKIEMEYRFWPAGSALTLVSSFLGNAFSIQGFILEEIPAGVAKWKVGLMKLSAPVVSAICMVLFAWLNLQSPQPIYQLIYSTSGLWAVAEILPFGSLDGKDIKDWNQLVWEVSFFLIGGSYLAVMFLI